MKERRTAEAQRARRGNYRFWSVAVAICSNCWRLTFPWALRGKFSTGIQCLGCLNLLSLFLSAVWRMEG